VAHVHTAPQRGVRGGEPAPRAAHQPGPRQDLGHVQLPEHGGERVRRHLRPVTGLDLCLSHGRSWRRQRGHRRGLGFAGMARRGGGGAAAQGVGGVHRPRSDAAEFRIHPSTREPLTVLHDFTRN
jgi:hypothetical protein